MVWIIYSMVLSLPDIRKKIINSYLNTTDYNSNDELSAENLRIINQILDALFFGYFTFEYLYR